MAGGWEDFMNKLVSIVIPCYRSAEMLEGVVADIGREMDNLKDKYRWELILVNDCSPDNTFEVIRRLCEKHKNICGVNLARNFGQHAALMAGFHQVKGDYLVCMDDDGQTPADAVSISINLFMESFHFVFPFFVAQFAFA